MKKIISKLLLKIIKVKTHDKFVTDYPTMEVRFLGFVFFKKRWNKYLEIWEEL